MGSCCSQTDDATQVDGPSERDKLCDEVDHEAKGYGTTLKLDAANNKSEMEDEKIGNIVKKVEIDVIDVPALRSIDEGRDFTDKAEKYSQKLDAAKPVIDVRKREFLLDDVPVPEEVLSKSPISKKGKEIMDKCFDKTQEALKDIKVHHKEDLVVPFILT